MPAMQVKLTALDVAALDASLLTVEVRGWTDVERITERLLSLLEDAAAAGEPAVEGAARAGPPGKACGEPRRRRAGIVLGPGGSTSRVRGLALQ